MDTRGYDSIVLEKASELLGCLPPLIELPDLTTTGAAANGGSLEEALSSPFLKVLAHEAAQWNGRLQTVSASLSELVKAVSGNAAMAGEMEDLYSALAGDRTPKQWQVKCCYATAMSLFINVHTRSNFPVRAMELKFVPFLSS